MAYKGICFNDKVNLTKRILDGTVTMFIKLKLKRYPEYRKGHVYSIMQPYTDIPEHLTKDIPLSHPGYRTGSRASANLMPHHLKITGIESMCLQEIPEEKYFSIGVEKVGNIFINGIKYKTYITYKQAFKHMVNRIFGKFTWQLNPLVWLYEFEIVN